MAGELVADTGAQLVSVTGQPISTDPTDRAGRQLGIVSITGQPIGVDVTDRAGRLVGVISAAALPLPAGAATQATLAAVSGQLPSVLVADRLKVDGSGVTQPVSLAAGVDVTDRAGRLVGVVDTELPAAAALSDALANPTTPLIGAALVGWSAAASNWQRGRIDGGLQIVRTRSANLVVPFAPAANTGGTLTLPAGGAGTRQVITHLRFVRVATAALAGTALLTITTTNISGPPAWRVGNAMVAGGTQIDMDQELVAPLIANTSGTAVTFVFPAPGAAVAWDCEVFYYLTTETV